MKKVLVISSSLRHGSNSEALAKEFARGAKDAGNEVDYITLRGKEIKFCMGCFSCQKTQKCVLRDDVPAILEKMYNADAIAFSSPIYFYELAGQLKTLLDRSYPLFPSDYRFRDIYILTSAAENKETTPERAIAGLSGWIDCYEKAHMSGTVFAGGVNELNEIEEHPSLKTAYDMGNGIA